MKHSVLFLFFVSFSIFSQNLLIKNTSFEEELYGWDYGVIGNTRMDRPVASFSTINTPKNGKSALVVNIEKSFVRSGGKNIYLIQDRLKLKKGKKYKASFYVKSKVENDEIYVAVGSGSGSKTERRIKIEKLKFKGNGQWQKLSITFTAKSIHSNKPVDLKNAAIYFGFNFREGKYLLDDVKVERIKK